MLVYIACLRALLLLSLLSDLAHAQNTDTTKKQNQTTYTSLNGKTYVLPGDDSSKKIILLVSNLKIKDLLQAIGDYQVIDYPSQDVIDAMNEAFTRANASGGIEQQFFVGKKGKVSIIVEGQQDRIDIAANHKVRVDLDSVKHDEPAYDVHTHGDSLSGEIIPGFSPEPSDTDRLALNFKGRKQTSIILSYERKKLPDLSTGNSQSVPFEAGASKETYIYTRVIVFYNQKGTIFKQDFSDFIKFVRQHAHQN